MIIKFKKLVIHNFLSIGDATIDLDHQGYVVISGVNENPVDNANSNGSGKSSLLESLSWVLTGETVRGTKNVVNMYGDDGTYVGLEMDVDGETYKILRSREHSKYKTNLRIVVNGVDKSGKGIKDSDQILKNLLPDITSDLIGSVILLGQGLPQRLTNNTPAGRKEVLEKLAKTDFMLEDLKTRVSNRKNFLTDKSKKLNDDFIALSTEKTILTTSIERNKKTLSEIDIKNIVAKIESYTDQIGIAQKDYDSLQSQVESKETLLNEQRTLYSKLVEEQTAELNSELSKFPSLESIDAKYPSSEDIDKKYPTFMDIKNKYPSSQDIESKYRDKLDPLVEQLNQTRTHIATLQADIRAKDSISDVCPTCGQKIIGVTKIDTTPLKNKVSALDAEYKIIQDKVSDIQLERQKESMLIESQIKDEYQNVVDLIAKEKNLITAQRQNEINEILSKKTKCTDEINEKYLEKKNQLTQTGISLSNEVSELKRKLSSQQSLLQSLKGTLARLEAEKEFSERSLNDLTKQVTEETAKIAEIDKKILYNQDERDDISLRLEKNSKFETALKRDFRGILLSNVIDFIHKKAQEYSNAIFHTDKIDFYLDGNNLVIGYNGKEYSSLSGGERQKVDIIVQFALRDMLCQYLSFSSNVLALDEITDGLDYAGCQEITNCIAKRLTDVSTVFIISHRTDLNLPCDKNIIVRKNSSGISQVIS